MVIDDEKDVLSSLRFADDVLLITQSLPDVRKMVLHLAEGRQIRPEVEYGQNKNPCYDFKACPCICAGRRRASGDYRANWL